VVIAGRDQKTLNEAAARIGEGALALKADVSNLDDLDVLSASIAKHAGKVDVLFANAGIAQFAPIALAWIF
jgi:NADP-dependent 3-hydroxy acid dehydrogenase YdfG